MILLSGSLSAQKLHVMSINPFGLEKTKPQAIFREMTFAPGDSLDLAKLDAILAVNQENLYNTQLFNEVKIEYEKDSANIWVRVLVKERWYIWPFPYATLEERNFNDWWKDKDLDRLAYGGGIQWSNFTGVGDYLYAFGQLGYSRRCSLIYFRPYIFPKARVDAHLGFYYVNFKEIGHSTIDGVLQWDRLKGQPMKRQFRANLDFTRRFTTRKRLKVGFLYDYFLPADTAIMTDEDPISRDSVASIYNNYLTTGLEREAYPSIFFRYTNDQRDIKSFPLKGYFFQVQGRQSGLPGWGTTRFFKGHVSWAQHFPLGKRFNFAYGMRQQFLIGKNVPFFDKQFIGWDQDLRGYENYVIDGSWLNLTKAEFKYAIVPRQMVHVEWLPFRRFRDFPVGVYLSVYGNAGFALDNTFSNQDTRFKQEMLNGYGIGMNFLFIYDLLLRFEVSRNHLGQTGIFLHSTVPIY